MTFQCGIITILLQLSILSGATGSHHVVPMDHDRAGLLAGLIGSVEKFDFVGVITALQTGGDPPLIGIHVAARFFDRNRERGTPALLLYPQVGFSKRAPIVPGTGSKWLVFLNDVIDSDGAVISEYLISFSAKMEGLQGERPFSKSERILAFGYEESLSRPPVMLLQWPEDATFRLGRPDYYNPLSCGEFVDVEVILKALLGGGKDASSSLEILYGLMEEMTTALGVAIVNRLIEDKNLRLRGKG